MIFKIAYGKEIHLLNSITTYQALQHGIQASFKKLPPCFTISYTDAEGDDISISNQEDLTVFENTVKTDKPVKITIQEVKEERIVTEAPVAEKTGFVEIIESIEDISDRKESQPESLLEESVISTISKEEVGVMVENEIRKIIPHLTERIIKQVENTSQSRIYQDNKTTQTKVSQEKPAQSHAQVVHNHVSCDGCGVSPIVGFRYKCLICHNFDFCDKCESEGKHAHAFIKIRHPSQVPRVLIASEESDQPGMRLNGGEFNFKDVVGNMGPVIGIANQLIPGLNLTEDKVKGFVDNFKKCKKEARDQKPHCRFGKFSDLINSFVSGVIPQPQENTEKKTEKPNEPKVEERKMEEKKVEMPKSSESVEDQHMSSAAYLQEMFERDYSLMLKFVKSNSTLGKCALAEKWIEENL